MNPERLATKTAHGHPPAKAASIARRVWRTAPSTPHPEALPGLEIAEVDYFDGSFAVFWEKVQHRFPVMVVRDPTYLNWRFVDVPGREYTAFAARSEGEIRGFTVLRATPLGQFSAGLIVELVVEASAEGRAAGRLLIDRAYSHFQRPGPGPAGQPGPTPYGRVPAAAVDGILGLSEVPGAATLPSLRSFPRRRRRSEPPGLRPHELVRDDGGLRRRVGGVLRPIRVPSRRRWSLRPAPSARIGSRRAAGFAPAFPLCPACRTRPGRSCCLVSQTRRRCRRWSRPARRLGSPP